MPLLHEHFGLSHIHSSTLYQTALTHRSFYAEQSTTPSQEALFYERLEFLGDSVLELMVSTYLYSHFQEMAEGKPTRMRSMIVCRKNLNRIAQHIALEKYIRTKIPLEQLSIDTLGNTYEALIGAIYLDQGFEATQQIVTQYLLENGHIDWKTLQGDLYDYRTIVLHWSQREHKDINFLFEELSHSPSLFLCKILIDTQELAYATGRNKKIAVQEASKYLVEKMNL